MPDEVEISQFQAYVCFHGKLWESQADELIEAFTMLSGEGIENIAFLINCPGGNIEDAFRLYQSLIQLGLTIHTHNRQAVHSAAHIFYQIGTTRSASGTSAFMIHGLLQPVGGNSLTMAQIDAALEIAPNEELVNAKRILHSKQIEYDTFLIDKTKLTQSDLDLITPGQKYFEVGEAIEVRLTDSISEIVPPPGARVVCVEGDIY